MNIFTFSVALCMLLTCSNLYARGGGGGFRGGGEGRFEEGGGFDGERVGEWDNRMSDEYRDPDLDNRVEGEWDQTDGERRSDEGGYDVSLEGPGGYRAGYVWRDGGYVAVDCSPWVPYAAPFGMWAGWSVITQPDYIQYPVYATYPVETAVQVALQNLGLYSGLIDGNAASCSEAIKQFQEQHNLPVTGTIDPTLLSALGVQASQQ